MPPGEDVELKYSRYGNTPNADVLHRRLAALEGTEAALVLSSGMGATACTMLALLRPGDHLVASHWLYGGTQKFLESELPAMGIEVTAVPRQGYRLPRAVDLLDRDAMLAELAPGVRELLAPLEVLLTVDSTNR